MRDLGILDHGGAGSGGAAQAEESLHQPASSLQRLGGGQGCGAGCEDVVHQPQRGAAGAGAAERTALIAEALAAVEMVLAHGGATALQECLGQAATAATDGTTPRLINWQVTYQCVAGQ